MYKHILYATDFSKASLTTEKKVAEISTQFKSQLSVIHVVNYGSTVWLGAGGYFILAELDEETQTESRKALQACEDRIGITVANTHSAYGSPKQKIVEYATEIGADLIVLGSHGQHQVADWFGTTASAVLQKANCDVLVVKNDE